MSDTSLYSIVPLAGAPAGQVSGEIGALKMVPINSLLVDMTYQRSMSAGSERTIKTIARDFDWRKFLPVICVPRENGYAIIDGQHRTTAALSIGLDRVPCYVLECSLAEAAGAFAAINGTVTRVSPVDIWFAQIAASDPGALDLKRILDCADVTVVRTKECRNPGETRSINVLRRAKKKHSEALLITVLQCITQTGNGNPGLVIGSVINGLARALKTKKRWLDSPSELFDRFDDVDLAEWLQAAKIEFARTKNPAQNVITRKTNQHLGVCQ